MGYEKIGSEDMIDELPPPIRTIAQLERFYFHRPERVQGIALDPQFDRRYFPQNCGAFQLPCFWIRRKYLYVYGYQTDRGSQFDLFEQDGPSGHVLFPVHPLALSHYQEFLSYAEARDARDSGLRLWAVPTSSTRTLLVWPDSAPEKALFVKVTLPFSIAGNRLILLRDIARGVGYTKLLKESASTLPASFEYLPEFVGFIPRTMLDSGVIVRSIPVKVKDGSIVIAPLFALFGGTNGHQPLFLRILERTGITPFELLNDVLCRQFCRLWLTLTVSSGIMLEGHAQNLMLALTPDLVPLGGFFYRDLDGLHVDWELRRLRGLPIPASLPRACDWGSVYAPSIPCDNGYCVWTKLRMSLCLYIYSFLNRLEPIIRIWHRFGLLREFDLRRHELIEIFSREMAHAVKDLFGVHIDAGQNLHHSQDVLLHALMRIRAEAIRQAIEVSLLPDGAGSSGPLH